MPARFSALICDDVRQEISGKLIAIGVYSENLGVNDFPMEGMFSCIFRADELPKNVKKLSIVMRHIGYERSEKTYDISNHQGAQMTMVLTGVPINATKPGSFFVEVSLDGGRYKKIEHLQIVSADGNEN